MMKQNELAQKLEITESMVSQMLAGKKAPGDELAGRLEKVTGIPATKWIRKKVTKSFFKKATSKLATKGRKVDRRKSHGRRSTNDHQEDQTNRINGDS